MSYPNLLKPPNLYPPYQLLVAYRDGKYGPPQGVLEEPSWGHP